jgi:hypothetical protein
MVCSIVSALFVAVESAASLPLLLPQLEEEEQMVVQEL